MSKMFVYVSSQPEGLAVFGPYTYKSGAEHALLVDVIDTLAHYEGKVKDMNDGIVNAAWSDTGYELDVKATDSVRLYLRTLNVEVNGVVR